MFWGLTKSHTADESLGSWMCWWIYELVVLIWIVAFVDAMSSWVCKLLIDTVHDIVGLPCCVREIYMTHWVRDHTVRDVLIDTVHDSVTVWQTLEMRSQCQWGVIYMTVCELLIDTVHDAVGLTCCVHEIYMPHWVREIYVIQWVWLAVSMRFTWLIVFVKCTWLIESIQFTWLIVFVKFIWLVEFVIIEFVIFVWIIAFVRFRYRHKLTHSRWVIGFMDVLMNQWVGGIHMNRSVRDVSMSHELTHRRWIIGFVDVFMHQWVRNVQMTHWIRDIQMNHAICGHGVAMVSRID